MSSFMTLSTPVKHELERKPSRIHPPQMSPCMPDDTHKMAVILHFYSTVSWLKMTAMAIIKVIVSISVFVIIITKFLGIHQCV